MKTLFDECKDCEYHDRDYGCMNFDCELYVDYIAEHKGDEFDNTNDTRFA